MTGIFIISIILFLSYYFINNYNSICVYKISGEDKLSYTIDGIFITSKEKSYIRLGKIVLPNEEKIVKYKLYYLNNNTEIKIFEGTNPEQLLINIFGKDELYSYSSIEKIKDNSFIEIISSNNNIYKIKLNFKKDFSNKKIFSKNKSSDSKEINKFEELEIPKYIKDNFNFNAEDNEYVLNITKNKIKIEQKYFLEMKILLITEQNDDKIEQYEYSFDDQCLSYSKISKEKVVDEFSYLFTNNTCILKKCNNEKINYFNDEYLKNIL